MAMVVYTKYLRSQVGLENILNAFGCRDVDGQSLSSSGDLSLWIKNRNSGHGCAELVEEMDW